MRMEAGTGARAREASECACDRGTCRVLVAICAVGAACALAAGVLMLLGPSDGMSWSRLAPMLANGVANAAAAALACSGRPPRAVAAAGFVAGAFLVVWCAAELLLFRNAMAAGYLVIGLLQTAFAVQLRR